MDVDPDALRSKEILDKISQMRHDKMNEILQILASEEWKTTATSDGLYALIPDWIILEIRRLVIK